MKKKIEECKKQFHKEKKEERKLFFTTVTIILGIPLSIALVMTTIEFVGNIQKKSDTSWMKKPQKSSFDNEPDFIFCKKSDPSKLEGYWVSYYKKTCLD